MKNNIPESHDINVDPLELKKFNQLAHRWWDQNGEFKPLHEI
ncbi:MAG: bifunctional 3-demethylubiquinol 3-O-methyltransferase/2-polyprenyl-6-hydroxyphenol methylase, partial [Nitrosospira sp.]|nr:bifunctional 3-demethylubiquinol 3-O-methyltransferase/2-polyprenyl-6-hydroxyphenol methylase [Nitrosospira sp.]